jgi:hypothetical protein
VTYVFDAGAQAALPGAGALVDPAVREELRVRIDERTRARVRDTLRRVVAPLASTPVETRVLDGLVVPTLHDTAARRRAVVAGVRNRGPRRLPAHAGGQRSPGAWRRTPPVPS